MEGIICFASRRGLGGKMGGGKSLPAGSSAKKKGMPLDAVVRFCNIVQRLKSLDTLHLYLQQTHSPRPLSKQMIMHKRRPFPQVIWLS